MMSKNVPFTEVSVVNVVANSLPPTSSLMRFGSSESVVFCLLGAFLEPMSSMDLLRARIVAAILIKLLLMHRKPGIELLVYLSKQLLVMISKQCTQR